MPIDPTRNGFTAANLFSAGNTKSKDVEKAFDKTTKFGGAVEDAKDFFESSATNVANGGQDVINHGEVAKQEVGKVWDKYGNKPSVEAADELSPFVANTLLGVPHF